MQRFAVNVQGVVPPLDPVPAQGAPSDGGRPPADAADEVLHPIVADPLAGQDGAGPGDEDVAKHTHGGDLGDAPGAAQAGNVGAERRKGGGPKPAALSST
ncbi:hypothetical protein D3C73_894400 [compost metagenome]